MFHQPVGTCAPVGRKGPPRTASDCVRAATESRGGPGPVGALRLGRRVHPWRSIDALPHGRSGNSLAPRVPATMGGSDAPRFAPNLPRPDGSSCGARWASPSEGSSTACMWKASPWPIRRCSTTKDTGTSSRPHCPMSLAVRRRHPRNPISLDIRPARIAGHIFRRGTHLNAPQRSAPPVFTPHPVRRTPRAIVAPPFAAIFVNKQAALRQFKAGNRMSGDLRVGEWIDREARKDRCCS